MEKLTKVGFKEFTRYVQSLKDAGKPCPCCGEMKWRLTTTLDNKSAGVEAVLAYALPFATVSQTPEDAPGDIMINNALTVLIKQCMSCGNMTFFNHDAVLDKINAQLSERDDENHHDKK